MYLVYLKYWTLNLMPPMVYPKVLFHPVFSIKDQQRGAVLKGKTGSHWRTCNNQKMSEWVSVGNLGVGVVQRSALCFKDAVNKGPLLDALPVEEHHHLQFQK